MVVLCRSLETMTACCFRLSFVFFFSSAFFLQSLVLKIYLLSCYFLDAIPLILFSLLSLIFPLSSSLSHLLSYLSFLFLASLPPLMHTKPLAEAAVHAQPPQRGNSASCVVTLRPDVKKASERAANERATAAGRRDVARSQKDGSHSPGEEETASVGVAERRASSRCRRRTRLSFAASLLTRHSSLRHRHHMCPGSMFSIAR